MKLRFERRKHETSDVWSYFFVPLDPIQWTAGQSIRLELPRKTLGVSERRFTIASAPSEQHVQITTRVSDSRFKQLLHELEPGTIINAHNIDGDFVWDDTIQNPIFIAGGIGITPFRSILAEAIAQDNQVDVDLLYSSKDEPVVFGKEFEEWQQPGLDIHYSTERLSSHDVTALEDWENRMIYISGPEAMVSALRTELVKAGVQEKNIKTDQFTGYSG